MGTAGGEPSCEASPAAALEAGEDDVEQDIVQLEALVEPLAGVGDLCHGLSSSRRKRRRVCQRVSRVRTAVDAALQDVYADGVLHLSAQEVAALASEAAQAVRRVERASGSTVGT